jgi:hypothetical protein
MAVDVPGLIGLLKQQLGKPYVFGSAGPGQFDCSGLTQYVYKPYGINLPHHAADQAKLGTAVTATDIQPGDLVFSDWGDGPNSHVGIAVSGQQIIDAPHTGAVVRYDTLSPSYLRHVTAIRRMSGAAGGGVSLGGVGGAIADATGLGAIADAIRTAAAPIVSVGKLSDQAFKIFMPSTFLRVVAGIAGGLLLLWGVFLLAREVRT